MKSMVKTKNADKINVTVKNNHDPNLSKFENVRQQNKADVLT